MIKIKRAEIFTIIFLLSIASQVFSYDYSSYTADLDRIHNEEINQDNIISAADLNITQAIQQKNQVANILAVTSCVPPMPFNNLVWHLYRYVRDHYEWYFHELRCDEDRLEMVCKNDYASKNRQELEQMLQQYAVKKEISKLRHDVAGRIMISLFNKQQDMRWHLTNIALQYRLVEENYKKCQDDLQYIRDALEKMDSEIINANTNKKNAQENKQKLMKKFEEKQQELDNIRQQQESIEQENLEVNNVVNDNSEDDVMYNTFVQ